MNFSLDDDQQMLRETFARFLDSESSPARVRAAQLRGGGQAPGFDRALWHGLAELGTFAMRVPAEAGGLGMGTLDAALVAEEAGRRLASGPIVEAILAARVLGQLGADEALLSGVLAGGTVATIAFHDIALQGVQWLAGGAHADLVIACRGEDVIALALDDGACQPEETLASNGLGAVDLGQARAAVLGTGPAAIQAFAAALEEWKLLTAAALGGLAREAVRLAAAYACERQAFGQFIGTYQAIAHPLANLIAEIDGAKYLTWKVIHDLAQGLPAAGQHVPLALWWSAEVASRAVVQSLRTFGGYGLTTEYDIHLYNLRAKAWGLILGDPARLLESGARRRYGDERAPLPDVGPVSIDFDLGEEARELAREVDAFFTRTLTPELRARAHHSWDGHHPEVHRKLAEADLLFPAWPKSKGGRGAPPYSRHAAGEVWEKHGWSNHATGTTSMVAAILERFGSDEVKDKVLGPVLRGEAICSLGYSEPGSGSDVFAAQCRAAAEGPEGTERVWRIDGTKMFTSGANISDFVLMLTRTDPAAAKHKGLTMFIVPMRSQGITVQPVYTFQDERTNVTFYDAVRVPDSYRLGDVDGGVRTMSAALELEHGGSFATSQKATVRAAETLCREIVHEGRPLIEDPLARLRLTRAWTHSLVSEMLGLRSLWAAHEKIAVPGAGPMSKMFSTEKFLADASDLLDLTAPLSLSKRAGAPAAINLAYRFAHGSTIWAGTSEIHRSMIAERALGLPRTRA